jgi:hypothetical protein
MNQLLIAVFGLTSIYCAMGNNLTLRKYAPIIGLCGQPFWGYFAYQTQGWGLAMLVLAYTLVYINGIRVQWGGK